MSHRTMLGALVALAALLASTPALAEAPAARAKSAESAPAAPRAHSVRARQAQSAATVSRRVTKDDGYSYAFGDDPLQAQGSDPGGARVAVRSGHVRGLLIRPRIQFVDALLKSVENI